MSPQNGDLVLANAYFNSIVGSEWDYVIISLVRSLKKDEIDPEPTQSWLREHLGFLTDEHQMNVGLTRARRGLCIIGKKYSTLSLSLSLSRLAWTPHDHRSGDSCQLSLATIEFESAQMFSQIGREVSSFDVLRCAIVTQQFCDQQLS